MENDKNYDYKMVIGIMIIVNVSLNMAVNMGITGFVSLHTVFRAIKLAWIKP